MRLFVVVWWLLLLLLLLGGAGAAASDNNDAASSSLDLRAAFPHCRAWAPVLDEGACSACTTASAAVAMSLRMCMRDGRNLRLSSAQLWDCASDGSCSAGTSLVTLLENIGSATAFALLPEACGPAMPAADPNATRCAERFAACPSPPILLLEAVVFADVVRFHGAPDYAAELAMRALMREIQTNGPVLAVITLVGADVPLFFGLGPRAGVFVPQALLPPAQRAPPPPGGQVATLRHSLVVYGWGPGYWLVQSSYGPAWGANGTARILRGANVLEAQWRGPTLVPRPCAARTELGCDQNLAALPGYAYGNYSLLSAAAAAHHYSSWTPPPPAPTAPTRLTHAPAEDNSAGPAPALDNLAILGVALACACIATLIGLFASCPGRAALLPTTTMSAAGVKPPREIVSTSADWHHYYYHHRR